VRGAIYLPTVWIHDAVLVDLLTSQTWKAAPIAQFAQQSIVPSSPSHHDRADLRHATATQRAEIAQDWQTHRLGGTVRAAIWDVAQLLPTAAIEIVPRLASSQLSVEQCAAIVEMMHHPIVPNTETDVIAGIFTAWGELFRHRVARVWSNAQLSCQTLTVSLELRSIPAIHTSGFAELHGDRLYVAATWGLPHILDTGLIEPDRFDLDLTSASLRAQTLGQKPCGYNLQKIYTSPSPQGLILQEISRERQAQFALQLDDLLALVELVQSIRHWQSPTLAAGLRIDWSFGLPLLPARTASDASPGRDREGDLRDNLRDDLRDDRPPRADAFTPNHRDTALMPLDLFVHDIAPLDRARPSFWFAETLHNQPPQPICTATWHGSSASGGRVTASAFVFKPRSGSAISINPSPTRTHPNPGEIWVCTKIPTTHLRDLRHASGLVVEAGSSTSHEILLARDLGLPIVVGVVGIVEALSTGDLLEIDANVGEVMRYTGSLSASSFQADRKAYSREASFSPPAIALESPLTAPSDITAPVLEGVMRFSPWNSHRSHEVQGQIDLRVSLSYLDRKLSLHQAWGGIGILRSEMLAFSEGLELALNPSSETQQELQYWLYRNLSLAIELCDSRPVFYRVFDRLTPAATLIDRGMHLYLDQPSLFDLQLNVLKQLYQNGHTQIRLLLPFVRSRAELEFCWQRLQSVGWERDNPSIEVWIMAEVPSVLMLLEEYCQMGIAGIAIGTNDLASLLLGIDREDGRSAAIAQAALPALHTAILALATTARRHGLACQLCYDDIVDDPKTLGDFLRAGVTAFSVSIDRLPQAAEALIHCWADRHD
jgi:pyruvate,water dikinase